MKSTIDEQKRKLAIRCTRRLFPVQHYDKFIFTCGKPTRVPKYYGALQFDHGKRDDA